LNNLYQLFPRQIAFPFRVTVQKDEFYKQINLLNGKKRIFSSVYNYTGNYEFDRLALVIDKVFFDFDGPESLPNALALMRECVNNDYLCMPLFSGGGFHVYVFTDGKRLQNPKFALTGFQTQFAGMDKTSVGDVARVATIPNTFNTKRGRFCIPVSLEDMQSGYEFVSDKAKEQCFLYRMYGKTRVSLTDGEVEISYQTFRFEEPRIKTRKIDRLPPCINDILSYQKKGYRGRYLVINYLKDAGYLESEIENIITEFCTEQEAKHCIHEEHQINRLYWKDIMFPYCEHIKSEGRCPHDCFCEFTREYGDRHLVWIYK